jgi:hypothetical protein
MIEYSVADPEISKGGRGIPEITEKILYFG